MYLFLCLLYLKQQRVFNSTLGTVWQGTYHFCYTLLEVSRLYIMKPYIKCSLKKHPSTFHFKKRQVPFGKPLLRILQIMIGSRYIKLFFQSGPVIKFANEIYGNKYLIIICIYTFTTIAPTNVSHNIY